MSRYPEPAAVDGCPVTVARLRADVERHVQFWPSNALGTAQQAVGALERLVAADPAEVFEILDELRGGAR